MYIALFTIYKYNFCQPTLNCLEIYSVDMICPTAMMKLTIGNFLFFKFAAKLVSA